MKNTIQHIISIFKKGEGYTLDINESINWKTLEFNLLDEFIQSIETEARDNNVSAEELVKKLIEEIALMDMPENYLLHNKLIKLQGMYDRFIHLLEAYAFDSHQREKLLSPFGFMAETLTDVNQTVSLLTLSTNRQLCRSLGINEDWLYEGIGSMAKCNNTEGIFNAGLYAQIKISDAIVQGKLENLKIIAFGGPLTFLENSEDHEIGIFIGTRAYLNDLEFIRYEKLATFNCNERYEHKLQFLMLMTVINEIYCKESLTIEFLTDVFESVLNDSSHIILNRYIQACHNDWIEKGHLPLDKKALENNQSIQTEINLIQKSIVKTNFNEKLDAILKWPKEEKSRTNKIKAIFSDMYVELEEK